MSGYMYRHHKEKNYSCCFLIQFLTVGQHTHKSVTLVLCYLFLCVLSFLFRKSSCSPVQWVGGFVCLCVVKKKTLSSSTPRHLLQRMEEKIYKPRHQPTYVTPIMALMSHKNVLKLKLCFSTLQFFHNRL